MPYRFEVSPSNRAGCSNKECKDNKIKIKKDDLRVGTWVERSELQMWQWRHWGCVTPKVIENITKAWHELTGDAKEDYSALDGYDDLPEQYQEKIRKALNQGHVDDEDWGGDLEMNRPGQLGFRVRTPKTKTDGKAAKDNENSPTKNKSAANNTAAKATEAADGASNEQEKLKANTKAARGKKVATKKESEGTDDVPVAEAKPKAKTATRTTRTKQDTTGNADEAVTQPKKRGRPAKATATAEAPTEAVKKGTKRKAKGDEQEEAVEEKPKRGRKKAAEKK